ncbi:CDP-glycerol glycerophosphotransferase family protein [Alteromonas halophila]|uniref:CDP-glycerol--glycerophosphate glycerophosphotransferase n=1 Tax=Alteromonas halophila TaxID=516698 RepID=A0A918JJY7_9ALTE|nr:CDP-glycerol glycerophosphotransferase family protein [Alteromonas halophila]GGW85196.1 CDP-glycerol--glycerophosphate glycerophosphotransferase [Alteromonas halophila]
MRFLFYISQNYSIDILRPLQAVMQEEGHEVCWFIEGEAVNRSALDAGETLLPSVKAVIAFNPDATYLPGNVVPAFIPGLKVQVFHGFEWKKKGHFRIRDCFDLYCTQGPFFTEKFLHLRAQHPHFTVAETGWPKLDPLFTSPPADTPSEMPEILYAPTFSPSLTSADALLDTIQTLSRSMPWKWTIKFHPKMDPAVVARYQAAENDKLSVSGAPSILPLLQRCDVMVSDTSSAITEFLLQQKPVVTFNNAQPEPVLINITQPAQLQDAVAQALADDDVKKQNIAEYARQMHPYTDGQSSQRVLAATLDELAHFPRPENRAKPRNWLRNLKLRKRLSYWK